MEFLFSHLDAYKEVDLRVYRLYRRTDFDDSL